MKQPQASPARPAWQYFKAAVPGNGLIVETCALSDFIRLAELYSAKAIFVLRATDDAPAAFAIAHNGSLLRQASAGYASLEDYQNAARAGYPDAAEYYSATAAGYKSYDDYRMALDSGIGEAATITAMKDGGFIAGYEAYTKLLATPRGQPLPDIGTATNAYQLYQNAGSRGFATWGELQAALLAGFGDSGDYKAVTEKGFSSAAQYEDATRRGFTDMASYQLALDNNFRDAKDGTQYYQLEIIAIGRNLLQDHKVLLILLSRLEQGKRVSANKLWEHLGRMIDEYRYDDGAMPAWFCRGLGSREELVQFLSGEDEVKTYGSYDPDGEFFETKRLRDRDVVLDGSNVAYNSAASGQEKAPTVANMLLMVRFLRGKGFERISIIADAALRHRLADKELLPELKAEAVYIESPAERPADIFIIHHVRTHHCLLVSNDTFREWKIQEPWVAENIDYYRLTFLIREGEVMMPDV